MRIYGIMGIRYHIGCMVYTIHKFIYLSLKLYLISVGREHLMGCMVVLSLTGIYLRPQLFSSGSLELFFGDPGR